MFYCQLSFVNATDLILIRHLFIFFLFWISTNLDFWNRGLLTLSSQSQSALRLYCINLFCKKTTTPVFVFYHFCPPVKNKTFDIVLLSLLLIYVINWSHTHVSISMHFTSALKSDSSLTVKWSVYQDKGKRWSPTKYQEEVDFHR